MAGRKTHTCFHTSCFPDFGRHAYSPTSPLYREGCLSISSQPEASVGHYSFCGYERAGKILLRHAAWKLRANVLGTPNMKTSDAAETKPWIAQYFAAYASFVATCSFSSPMRPCASPLLYASAPYPREAICRQLFTAIELRSVTSKYPVCSQSEGKVVSSNALSNGRSLLLTAESQDSRWASKHWACLEATSLLRCMSLMIYEGYAALP